MEYEEATNEKTSPKQQQQQRPRRGVQFHSRGSIEQVRRISRYSNYSEDELIAYWGETDEFKLRKQDLREAVQEWQAGRRMSDNLNFTTIGLMDKIGEGRKEKKKIRETSRQAVMYEQELQDLEGDPDDELLSSVYQATSAKSKEKAHEEALHMADEVKKLAEENADS